MFHAIFCALVSILFYVVCLVIRKWSLFMFTHIVLGANDIEKSRVFYHSLLGALGYDLGVRTMFVDNYGNDNIRYKYSAHQTFFLLTQPVNKKPVVASNGMTTCFSAPSRDYVDREFSIRG